MWYHREKKKSWSVFLEQLVEQRMPRKTESVMGNTSYPVLETVDNLRRALGDVGAR